MKYISLSSVILLELGSYNSKSSLIVVLLRPFSRQKKKYLNNFNAKLVSDVFLHISSMFGSNIIYKTMPPMHGSSIGIGLAPNGPQVKTTEPMVSNKVTNCSIQIRLNFIT